MFFLSFFFFFFFWCISWNLEILHFYFVWWDWTCWLYYMYLCVCVVCVYIYIYIYYISFLRSVIWVYFVIMDMDFYFTSICFPIDVVVIVVVSNQCGVFFFFKKDCCVVFNPCLKLKKLFQFISFSYFCVVREIIVVFRQWLNGCRFFLLMSYIVVFEIFCRFWLLCVVLCFFHRSFSNDVV